MMIRYYLQSADEAGYKQHPETVMRDLGFKLIAGLPETIADLWFFEVEQKEDVPKWLDIVDEKSIKELPEWSIAYRYNNPIYPHKSHLPGPIHSTSNGLE